jgi:hypothetical protein
MRTWPYFVPEDDELPYFTDDERAFAAVLSEATAPLVCSEVNDLLIPSAIARDFQRGNGLVAALWLQGESLQGERHALLHFGVHYGGNRVRGGRLHNQCYDLEDRSPGPPLDASGDVAELARQAARWFEAVMRRPVVLYVWLHAGYAYAVRYTFADTQEILHHFFRKERAPRDWVLRAMTRGRFSINSLWMQVHGLPEPDFYLYIRGDMQAAVISPGIRRAERHGPLAGPWLQ